ncbi:hypothetical protein [Spiroplasma endosymbiont of Apeira syringaria]|uniref:hypothetical protein n=1 Tax=Spiroplasma endosymbiont of Apeira syringaria TaxID=3066307 RepID=UPI0030D452CB
MSLSCFALAICSSSSLTLFSLSILVLSFKNKTNAVISNVINIRLFSLYVLF